MNAGVWQGSWFLLLWQAHLSPCSIRCLSGEPWFSQVGWKAASQAAKNRSSVSTPKLHKTPTGQKGPGPGGGSAGGRGELSCEAGTGWGAADPRSSLLRQRTGRLSSQLGPPRMVAGQKRVSRACLQRCWAGHDSLDQEPSFPPCPASVSNRDPALETNSECEAGKNRWEAGF